MAQENAQRAGSEAPEPKPDATPVGNIRYQGVEATIWSNPTEKVTSIT